MPYKRAYKKRSTKKRGSSTKKLWKKVKYLSKLVRPEIKKHDAGFGPITLSGASGNVQHITNIEQGSEAFQRTGNMINIKYISVKGQIQFNTNSGATDYQKAQVRVVVVRDNQQQDATTPAVLDVFKEISAFSPLNADNVGRFTILASQVLTFSSTSPTKKINMFIRKFIPVRYSGEFATEINRNGIYVMFVPKYVDAIYTSKYEAICRLGFSDV